jgi:hypothetical protein
MEEDENEDSRATVDSRMTVIKEEDADAMEE